MKLEEVKKIEKRNAKLINLILDYAIENQMSLEEVDGCMEQIERVYYTDGLIKRDKAEN